MNSLETKIKKQPNSHNCFVCGISNPIGLKLKIYEVSPWKIESKISIPDLYQGYPGVVHGGIVATILDEISGRALMGDSASPRFMFTGKLEVKYRKNVPVNQPLKIIGEKVTSKGKIAEGWAGIYDENDQLLAEAKTLLVDVPDNLLSASTSDELGWKVYPD